MRKKSISEIVFTTSLRWIQAPNYCIQIITNLAPLKTILNSFFNEQKQLLCNYGWRHW